MLFWEKLLLEQKTHACFFGHVVLIMSSLCFKVGTQEPTKIYLMSLSLIVWLLFLIEFYQGSLYTTKSWGQSFLICLSVWANLSHMTWFSETDDDDRCLLMDLQLIFAFLGGPNIFRDLMIFGNLMFLET